jgi:hypothetical protein
MRRTALTYRALSPLLRLSAWDFLPGLGSLDGQPDEGALGDGERGILRIAASRLGSAARRQHGLWIWPLKCGNDTDPGTPRVYLDTGVAAVQRVAGASPAPWCLLRTDGYIPAYIAGGLGIAGRNE